MLKVLLSIPNPFSKGGYSSYYNYTGVISGNKLLMINIDRDPRNFIDINLDCGLSNGPSIELRVFGFGGLIQFLDRGSY
jgi:hypothetical protein